MPIGSENRDRCGIERPPWLASRLVGLDDELAARLEAEQQKARTAHEQMQAAAQQQAWYARRPWASPRDELVRDPPQEYAELVRDAHRRLLQPPPSAVPPISCRNHSPAQRPMGSARLIDPLAWSQGLLYLDRQSKERLAQHRRGAWRTSSRYIRKVYYFHRDNGSYSSGPYGGDYAKPTWSFTILDNGRVGALLGSVDKLTQVIADIIMGQYPR